MFKIFTKDTLIIMGVLIAALVIIWQVNRLEAKKRDFKEQQIEIKAEQEKEEASVEIIEEQMQYEVNITKERDNAEVPTTIGRHTITFD